MNFAKTIGVPPARARDRGNRAGDRTLRTKRTAKTNYFWELFKPIVAYVGTVTILVVGSLGAL